MKKLTILALAVILIMTAIFPVSAAENTVYISPRDSIADAIAQISGGGKIVLREGIYNMTEVINLTSSHSDITIEGEGAVTITGGSEVPYSSFVKCSDTTFLDALSDQSARDKIVTVNLFDLGIKSLGEIKPQGFTSPTGAGYAPTLTYLDKALSMARYPNNDYVYTETVSTDTSTKYFGNHYKVTYTLTDKRYESWAWDDVWSTSFFRVNWADSTTPAGKNNDGTLYGYTGTSYEAVVGSRLYFFNVPEEIDVPGEWYLNRETGVLYLYPDADMKTGDTLIYNSYDKNFFDINGSKNITFRNIRFCGTCKRGVYAQNADGIVFDNCEFTGIGDTAVYFKSCYRSGVRNSYFHDLGSWGVYFMTCGDRKTLTSGECFATNTHFERFTQYRRTYSPAIQMYNDVGTVVSHCKFNDAPHFAIRYESNNSIIEYCEFYDVCLDTADTGAVYTGRRWETRGNEIRYNYFHDLSLKTATGYGVQAVYLDDMSSSTKVFGNVFFNVDRAALIGGGRYNEFSNNIMLNCKGSVTVDARATDWASTGTNLSELQKVPYTGEIWAKAYPELVGILDDEPEIPKHNVLKNNVLYDTPPFSLNSYVTQYGTVNNNITTHDSNLFENPAECSFTLNKNGEIFKLLPEFKDIPFEEMGLLGEGPTTPEKIYVSRSLYTEDFIFESEAGSILENWLRDFPSVNANTTTGGVLSVGSHIKNNTSNYYWDKTNGIFGIKRVARDGVTDLNGDSTQRFTIQHEVPMYKGSRYSLTFNLANPDEVGSGTIWTEVHSPSAAKSPFTTATSTDKLYGGGSFNSGNGFTATFAEPTDGFGKYSDGTRPNETGSVNKFNIGLFFNDIMAKFDSFEVVEFTPYSKLNIKQSLGGSASISGYTLSGSNRTQIKNQSISQGETVALESGMTATLSLTPDSGKTAVVLYNDAPLVVNNNSVSFIPTEGGTLHIQYKNSDPTVTSIMAGTPVYTSDYSTSFNGETITSDYSVIMYAVVNIGTDKAYETSGYYVTKLDESENVVGETVALPAIAVPIGDTYAIRLVGEALTAGTYMFQPYLITTDKTEYTGKTETVTIN